MLDPLGTVKGILVAAFIAAVLSMALFTPLALHFKIVDGIPALTRAFCPETGIMAPRFSMGKSWHRDPEQWVACLDEKGRRIERLDRHYAIIWSLNAFGFALLIPPIAWCLRSTFWSTEAKLKHRAQRKIASG